MESDDQKNEHFFTFAMRPVKPVVFPAGMIAETTRSAVLDQGQRPRSGGGLDRA